MIKISSIRHIVLPLKRTPFHPQWFVFKNQNNSQFNIGRITRGLVLDIGAGKQLINKFLTAGCRYFSLDFYKTATEWYHTRPDIFGDGQKLPIQSATVDTALLLDVLEHIPSPDDCLGEILRVLQPGGICILQVPFLYPLHDAPYDFQRWTLHGLRTLASRHGFKIESELTFGHPLESAALLMNLALSKTVLNWAQQKSPLLLLAPLLVAAIPVINIACWLLAKISGQEHFMPHSYRVILRKPQ